MKRCKNDFCDKEFVGRHHKVFCTKYCANEQRLKNSSIRKDLRTCAGKECEGQFKPRFSKHAYCSQKCGYTATNKKRKEEKPPLKTIKGICKECSGKITQIGGLKRKYCSDLCSRRYYERTNADKINLGKRIKSKYRRDNDPLYKIKGNLRCLTWRAFNGKGWSKKGGSKELLGCEWEQVICNIESNSKIKNGPNTHIDHIVPLDYAQNREELVYLCHWTNLQFLSAEDNNLKANKLTWSKRQRVLLKNFNDLFRSQQQSA